MNRSGPTTSSHSAGLNRPCFLKKSKFNLYNPTSKSFIRLLHCCVDINCRYTRATSAPCLPPPPPHYPVNSVSTVEMERSWSISYRHHSDNFTVIEVRNAIIHRESAMSLQLNFIITVCHHWRTKKTIKAQTDRSWCARYCEVRGMCRKAGGGVRYVSRGCVWISVFTLLDADTGRIFDQKLWLYAR